jgi:hypothetical protein
MLGSIIIGLHKFDHDSLEILITIIVRVFICLSQCPERNKATEIASIALYAFR